MSLATEMENIKGQKVLNWNKVLQQTAGNSFMAKHTDNACNALGITPGDMSSFQKYVHSVYKK